MILPGNVDREPCASDPPISVERRQRQTIVFAIDDGVSAELGDIEAGSKLPVDSCASG